VISGRIMTSPRLPEPPTKAKHAVEILLPRIRALLPHLRNARWIAYRLIEGDYRLRQALISGELAALSAREPNASEPQSQTRSLAGR
jgi:GTP-binding protein